MRFEILAETAETQPIVKLSLEQALPAEPVLLIATDGAGNRRVLMRFWQGGYRRFNCAGLPGIKTDSRGRIVRLSASSKKTEYRPAAVVVNRSKTQKRTGELRRTVS